MGITEKMWDGITRVIRMDTKVEALVAAVKNQQIRIEGLIERAIRLETVLEIALGQTIKSVNKRLKKPGKE